MYRKLACAVAPVAYLVAAAGCAGGERPTLADAPASSPPSSATGQAVGIVESGGHSDAVVRIGDSVFDFAVTCYDAGSGDVLAVGRGERAGDTVPAEVVVQAFTGDPYALVQLDDGSRFEPALQTAITFVEAGGAVTASAIDFVTDLDLVTGEGTPVGPGSITLVCDDYRPELPADY